MEREKFLRTLTAGHHEALLLCRELREEALKIRSDGAMGAWEALSSEVRRSLKERLLPHFLAEDKLVSTFAYLIGRAHPALERMTEDHRRLRALLHEGSLGSLLLFSRELEDHIQFEEAHLYPLFQETLNEAEKLEASQLLDRELAAGLKTTKVPDGDRPAA
jgi:hypothetical protein